MNTLNKFWIAKSFKFRRMFLLKFFKGLPEERDKLNTNTFISFYRMATNVGGLFVPTKELIV